MKIAVVPKEVRERLLKRNMSDTSHIVFAYEAIFEAACDPNSKVVEFKPEILAAIEAYGKPVDMLIFCPKCGKQHIDRPDEDGPCVCECPFDDHDWSMDAPDARCRNRDCGCGEYEAAWTNPPHKSHTCRTEDGGCGVIFRVADFPTNGVAAIKTVGKDDTWVLPTTDSAK